MAHYEQILLNKKTGEQVYIKSNDWTTFQSKIEKRKNIWKKQNKRLQQIEKKEAAIQHAEEDTETAQKEINEYKNLLKSTLTINDVIDWKSLELSSP